MTGFEEGKGETKIIQIYRTCMKVSKILKNMY